MEELVKELGLRFTVHSTADINHVYVRNLKFIEGYLRMAALLVTADALQLILSVVRGHRGISLTELLGHVIGQDEVKVEADDIYFLIVRGDIYVDLRDAPLAVPERVKVFENREVAEAYTPPGGVPSTPTAKYMDVDEGSRLLWDGKPWKVANVGAGRVWLLGEGADAALPHERFEEYITSGVIELLDSTPRQDPYRQALEILDNVEPHVRAEADRRFELIKPYLDKEKPLAGASKERSIRRYIAAFKESLSYSGTGLVGLLPGWCGEGKGWKRLHEQVYKIMDGRIESDYETPVQKSITSVYRMVLADCEAQGIPENQQPRYETFWKRVNRRPRADQVRKRKGKRAAYPHETHTYWIEKNTPPHGDRPFEIAHADCTKLDIELVCPITGENMGRPWAAFLVDAHTRVLLAMVVTYDEPSYRTTMMLLRECARRHKRLPETLIVDRGKEFDNIYLRRLASTFEITVKFRPPSKPRHGSVGERLFGTANEQFVHNLKGNTQIMTEIRKVMKTDNPRTQAAWTLSYFTEWFTAWGYGVYNNQPHWTLKERPNIALARTLELTGKRRRRVTYDETFLILTMPTTRKSTAKNVPDKGVKINYIFYWNDALRERFIEKKQLLVRYDPYNISVAYVQIRGRWVQCTAEYYATFENCTERQLKIASNELRKRNAKFSKTYTHTAVSLANFIRDAEEVQKGLSEKRLLNQRIKDREFRPLLTVINGGGAGLSPDQRAGIVGPEKSVEDSETQQTSPFSAIDFERLGRLKELK